MRGDMNFGERVWENEGGRLRRPESAAAPSPGPTSVRVRRIYEAATEQDGIRVLVDRLWPRGVSKSRAEIDEWCRDIAPSTALRRWYGHDQQRFAEFRRRYRHELATGEHAAALYRLTELTDGRTLTLLTATRDPAISEAAVLAELLEQKPRTLMPADRADRL